MSHESESYGLGSRTRRKPGENRRRLIEAGILEFAYYGYHAASTGAIALRAEVPQPHVYASFRSKRELFLACARQAIPHPVGAHDYPFNTDISAAMLVQLYAAVNDTGITQETRLIINDVTADLTDDILSEILLRGVSAICSR